jgi:hypothetical protein
MTKNEFLEIINDLGFKQFGERIFYLITDRLEELVIIIGESDYFQLNLEKRSFGNFSLPTFGDKNDVQMELFFSFINGSFNSPNTNIIKFMIDRKIKDILVK